MASQSRQGLYSTPDARFTQLTRFVALNAESKDSHMNFHQVGFTKRTHGIKGEIKVPSDHLQSLSDLAFVFIEMEGIKVPWEIEWIVWEKPTRIKFTGIDSIEEAHALVGKPLYAAEKDLTRMITPIQAEKSAFHWIEGFQMHEASTGLFIGKIKEVRSFPNQEMAVVILEGQEKLIPLAEPLIHKIDRITSTIIMDLPEGLMEL